MTSLSTDAFAQRDRRPGRARGRDAKIEQVKDTIVLSDSAKAVRDSIHRADSAFRADSISMLRKSSLEMPVFSGAKDSIVEYFGEG